MQSKKLANIHHIILATLLIDYYNKLLLLTLLTKYYNIQTFSFHQSNTENTNTFSRASVRYRPLGLKEVRGNTTATAVVPHKLHGEIHCPSILYWQINIRIKTIRHHLWKGGGIYLYSSAWDEIRRVSFSIKCFVIVTPRCYTQQTNHQSHIG